MFKKVITFLLLLNFVTTLSVGYIVYTNVPKEYNITVEATPSDKEFETNMRNGMSQLMLGQNFLNVGLLRVHHFVEPHVDMFYENCPECEKDKARILEEEKDSITSK